MKKWYRCVPKICQNCGKSFLVEKWCALRPNCGRFCSSLCRQQGVSKEMRVPLQDRFWLKVEKSDQCWLWTGSKDEHGYGRINSGDRTPSGHPVPKLATRVSWELTHGQIADGLFVCHRCDNPPCVRPDHLFLGTQKDNMADSAAKGRWYSPNRKPRHLCCHGHELTPENTYIDRNGHRECRICRRKRTLESLYRLKGKVQPTQEALPLCLQHESRSQDGDWPTAKAGDVKTEAGLQPPESGPDDCTGQGRETVRAGSEPVDSHL